MPTVERNGPVVHSSLDAPWRQFGATIIREALDFALPSACLGCEHDLPPHREGRGGAHTWLRLCRRCRSRLHRHEPNRCRHCARKLERVSPGPRSCPACAVGRSSIDDLLTCFDYQEPFDQVMRAFKFGGFRLLARPLACELWELHAERLSRADVIVPVPSHWRRRLARGFNPPAELARHLTRHLSRLAASPKPIEQPLRRLPVAPQSRVDLAERARNARRAFALRENRRDRLAHSHVLLLDDVTTTGATLEVCARLLKRNGAERVTAAVLGWTPPPRG